jgi:hypothetical protein
MMKWQAGGVGFVDSRLTGSGGKGGGRPSLEVLLAKAGLETWQSPEGFQAIRVRPLSNSMAPPRRPRWR